MGHSGKLIVEQYMTVVATWRGYLSLNAGLMQLLLSMGMQYYSASLLVLSSSFHDVLAWSKPSSSDLLASVGQASGFLMSSGLKTPEACPALASESPDKGRPG